MKLEKSFYCLYVIKNGKFDHAVALFDNYLDARDYAIEIGLKSNECNVEIISYLTKL